MNTTIRIDYFYPTPQEPVLVVLSVNDSKYLLGLRQQIHQEAMSAPGIGCKITHVCVPSLSHALSEPQILSLSTKITRLMPNEYCYIALTALAQGHGIETGHTTYVIVMRDSSNTPYITLINQSTNRAANAPYQLIFREIAALIPDARFVGKEGMINGIFPLGSFFYMCMESGVLLQKIHQYVGTDRFIEVFKNYSEQYEAAELLYESAHLTYEQVIALPATKPFLFKLEELVRLRFSIGIFYRESLGIEQREVNGAPMSVDNILDSSIISAQEVIQYLAGRSSCSGCADALQQNILETLPFVSMTELGSPENLVQLLFESLAGQAPERAAIFDESFSYEEAKIIKSDARLLFSLKELSPQEPSFPKSRVFLKLERASTPFYMDILFDCIDEHILTENDLKKKALSAAEFIVKFYDKNNITSTYQYVKDFLFEYGIVLQLSKLSRQQGTEGRGKRKRLSEDDIIAQLTWLGLSQLIAAAKYDAEKLTDTDLHRPVKSKKRK